MAGIFGKLFSEEQITWRDNVVLPVILICCMVCLVSGTYNPFIYFRF